MSNTNTNPFILVRLVDRKWEYYKHGHAPVTCPGELNYESEYQNLNAANMALGNIATQGPKYFAAQMPDCWEDAMMSPEDYWPAEKNARIIERLHREVTRKFTSTEAKQKAYWRCYHRIWSWVFKSGQITKDNSYEDVAKLVTGIMPAYADIVEGKQEGNSDE